MKFDIFTTVFLSVSLSRPTTAFPTSYGPHLPRALPMQTIAGVSVPDTPIVRDAMAFARAHSDDFTYKHVMRSWLFGALAVANNATLAPIIDPEILALGTILHDLGWDETPGSELITSDRRFEVDGAIAAREFIRGHPDGKGWDERRVQLVWDSIALHTEHKIVEYKEPDTLAVYRGIGMDFEGPGDRVGKEEYDAVLREFPEPKLKERSVDKTIWLCRTKPKSTYDNWMQAFGEALVANYSAKGYRMVDMMLGMDEMPPDMHM